MNQKRSNDHTAFGSPTGLTEIQQITLRDILVKGGLESYQVIDIFHMLSTKRERVQLAFYYRVQGMTYQETGDLLGVSHVAVQKMVKSGLSDIHEYLFYGVVTK